jgi:hypothetical protein
MRQPRAGSSVAGQYQSMPSTLVCANRAFARAIVAGASSRHWCAPWKSMRMSSDRLAAGSGAYFCTSTSAIASIAACGSGCGSHCGASRYTRVPLSRRTTSSRPR